MMKLFRAALLVCVVLFVFASSGAAEFEVTVHAVPLRDKAGVPCFSEWSQGNVMLCLEPWTEYRGPKNDPGFPEQGWYCDQTLGKRRVPGGDVYVFVSQDMCSLFGDVPEGWKVVPTVAATPPVAVPAKVEPAVDYRAEIMAGVIDPCYGAMARKQAWMAQLDDAAALKLAKAISKKQIEKVVRVLTPLVRDKGQVARTLLYRIGLAKCKEGAGIR